MGISKEIVNMDKDVETDQHRKLIAAMLAGRTDGDGPEDVSGDDDGE